MRAHQNSSPVYSPERSSSQSTACFVCFGSQICRRPANPATFRRAVALSLEAFSFRCKFLLSSNPSPLSETQALPASRCIMSRVCAAWYLTNRARLRRTHQNVNPAPLQVQLDAEREGSQSSSLEKSSISSASDSAASAAALLALQSWRRHSKLVACHCVKLLICTHSKSNWEGTKALLCSILSCQLHDIISFGGTEGYFAPTILYTPLRKLFTSADPVFPSAAMMLPSGNTPIPRDENSVMPPMVQGNFRSPSGLISSSWTLNCEVTISKTLRNLIEGRVHQPSNCH